MNAIVLKKFKTSPGRAKCTSCQKIVPPKTKFCKDCTHYCAVCEWRSVPTNTKVCKNCVQFFLTLKNNVTKVSCTQSPTCFQFSSNSFCPLHKYIKCQMHLEQNQPNDKTPVNSNMVPGKKIQRSRRNPGARSQDTSLETSMEENNKCDVNNKVNSSEVNDTESPGTPHKGTPKIQCGVCQTLRVPSANSSKMCKKCFQFSLTIQINKMSVSCRKDESCSKFSPKKFCPLHKYHKCLELLKVCTDVRVVLERLDITSEQSIACKISRFKLDSLRNNDKSSSLDSREKGVDLMNNNIACDNIDNVQDDPQCNRRSTEEKIEFFKDIQIRERCCGNSKILTPVKQIKEVCKILKMDNSLQLQQRGSKILKLVKIVRPGESTLQENAVTDEANPASNNSKVENKTQREEMISAKETANTSDELNKVMVVEKKKTRVSNSERELTKTVDETGLQNNCSEVYTANKSEVQKKQCDDLKDENTTNETSQIVRGNVVDSNVKIKTNSSSKKSHNSITDQPKKEATKKIHSPENVVSKKEKSSHLQEPVDKKTEIVKQTLLSRTVVDDPGNQNKKDPNKDRKRSSSSSSKDKKITNKKCKTDDNVKQQDSSGKSKDRISTSSCSKKEISSSSRRRYSNEEKNRTTHKTEKSVSSCKRKSHYSDAENRTTSEKVGSKSSDLKRKCESIAAQNTTTPVKIVHLNEAEPNQVSSKLVTSDVEKYNLSSNATKVFGKISLDENVSNNPENCSVETSNHTSSNPIPITDCESFSQKSVSSSQVEEKTNSDSMSKNVDVIMDFVANDELDFEEEDPNDEDEDFRLQMKIQPSTDPKQVKDNLPLTDSKLDKHNQPSTDPALENDSSTPLEPKSSEINCDTQTVSRDANQTSLFQPVNKAMHANSTYKENLPYSDSETTSRPMKASNSTQYDDRMQPYRRDSITSSRNQAYQSTRDIIKKNEKVKYKEAYEALMSCQEGLAKKEKLRQCLNLFASSLVEFVCLVSCDQRRYLLKNMLTNLSSDLLRMSIACYALYWNSTFSVGYFFQLLKDLYGDRYDKIVMDIAALVILLPYDVEFDKIVLEFGAKCGRTSLLHKEDRKHTLTSKILPLILLETQLYIPCFKLLLANNLRPSSRLIQNTLRIILSNGSREDCDFFAEQMLKTDPCARLSTLLGRREILALLRKLKSDQCSMYEPFLRSMPDDIVSAHRCVYQNYESSGEHGLNLNEFTDAISHVDDRAIAPRDHFETPKANELKRFPDNSRPNIPKELVDPRAKVFGNQSKETRPSLSDGNPNITKTNEPLFMSIQNTCLPNSTRTVILQSKEPPRSILKIPSLFGKSSEQDSLVFRKSSTKQDSLVFGKSSTDQESIFGKSPTKQDSLVFGKSPNQQTSLLFGKSPVQQNSTVFGRSRLEPNETPTDSSTTGILKKSTAFVFGQNSKLSQTCTNPIQTSTNNESTGNWVDTNSNEDCDIEIFEAESSVKSVFGKSSPVFGKTWSKPMLENVFQPVFGNSASVEPNATVFGRSAARQHGTLRLSDEHKHSVSSSTDGKSTSVFGHLSTPSIFGPDSTFDTVFDKPSGLTNPWKTQTHNANQVVNTTPLFGTMGRTLFPIPKSESNDPNETYSDGSDVEIVETKPIDVIEIDSDDSEEYSEFNIIEPVEYKYVPNSNSSTNGRISPPHGNNVSRTPTNNGRIASPPKTDNIVAKNIRILTPYSVNPSGNTSNKRQISFNAQLENVRVFDPDDQAASEISGRTPNIRNGNNSPVEYSSNNENARISESRDHNNQSPNSTANYGPRNLSFENCNGVVTNLVSQIDSKYRHLHTSAKLTFIHNVFYGCPLVRNQFDLILELCERTSDSVYSALFEIVLNKVIDSESKGYYNDMMRATLQNQLRVLTKSGIDKLIKTPVICEDKWSPLRIWCFVCEYQTLDDAFAVLERYHLLEEDPRSWKIPYEESDLETFYQVITNLLRDYSCDENQENLDMGLMIHLSCLLLALYKHLAQNSSPDVPRILETSVFQIINYYLLTFYKTLKPKPVHVSNDDLDYDSERDVNNGDEDNFYPEREEYKAKFEELCFRLPPLMNNLLDVVPDLCSSSYSKTFIRACVMYFMRNSLSDDNIDHVFMLMKSAPHIYTFYNEGNVIVLKDIYSEEEMVALLSYAFQKIASSPFLVESIKRNTTILMIHLEKSSQSTQGSSLVSSLKYYLPGHLKMHNRNPMMRLKKVLKAQLQRKMATLELSDEQPEECNNLLHLDNLSVIAHINTIQNKELLKPLRNT